MIDYHDYLTLLQVSSVHVYLTYPFVLSWSFIEAMASGCLIVGSATPPVLEVLRDGENGFAVDFFLRGRWRTASRLRSNSPRACNLYATPRAPRRWNILI